MTPATISITPGVGQLLDAVTLIVGAQTVVRETMVIADPTSPTQLAGVTAGGALMVDGSAVPQPVINTGTFAVQATLASGTAVIGHVIVDSGNITASIAASQTIQVTNLGTFVVQATLAAETTKVIGRVNQGTTPWTVDGTVTFSNTTIAVTNAGTFAVQAVLNAETTKVIGRVNQGTTPWVVTGDLTHNLAAPAATNVGALTAVANAAAPTYIEGDQVLLSTDLQGNARVYNTPIRTSAILSTTPLLAAGAYTQAWQDSTLNGTIGIECTVRADQASGILGFVIQETDDTSNANFFNTLTAFSVVAGVTLTARTLIRARYYRVIYTNGAVNQGAFELTQTTTSATDATLAAYSVVDPLNSTTTPLIANATFTGAAVDLLPYKAVSIVIFADKNGALNGAQMQWSQDGTNWDLVNPDNVFANIPVTIQDTIRARFYRFVYVNGTVGQGVFRVQTLLHPTASNSGIQSLGESVDPFDTALITHSVITGKAVTQQDYVDLKVAPSGAMLIASEGSVLGDVVVSTRRSQFDVNFSTGDATDATIITNSTTGTGAVTQANGEGLFSTGTGASGEAKGVTVQSLIYRSGSDVFCEFTAAFTTPTDSTNSNFQRIGLYDTNNGFYIGYEKNVFGITTRVATVDTQVPLASFNLDPLNGSAQSTFTRAGVIEAVNFTKLNLYRVRFSWFGAANIYWDIFTPDGGWLPFHVIRYPNTSTVPSLASPNIPMTVDAVKSSSDGTNLQIRTACWATGLNESAIRLSDPMADSTLASPTRSVIVGKMPSGVYENVGISAEKALNMSGSGAASINAATWTSTTESTIASINGATNAASTNVTTLTATYTPTAGADHAVVVTFNAGGAYANLVVQDNLGHTLTAGPTIGNLASFYQFPVPAGAITGYTATWTTGRQSAIAVEEYSGVNAINAALAGNTASATSNSSSITVTPDEFGDVVVGAFGNSSTDSFTGTVGNTRQNVVAGTAARMILMDTSASPATCTATHTSDAWSGVAIGLRPTITGGTALNTALVMVNNSFAYNSVTVELVGTSSFLAGAITFEVSIDNVHWSGLLGTNVTTGLTAASAVVTLTTGTTCLSFNNTGFQYFRARLSSQIVGGGQVVVSYTVQGLASPNVSSNITTGTINVNGNQGTPNSLPNSWPTTITDGTNGPAAVKAASVAALTTDAALVVAISPNNAVATTHGMIAVATQTWSTVGGAGTAVTVSTVGMNTVVATFNGTATITTGQASFFVSDDGGVTYYVIQGRNIATGAVGTTLTLTAALVSFEFNVAGFTNFQVTNSVTITGASGSCIVRAQASAADVPPAAASVINATGTNLGISLTTSGTITFQSSTVSAITNTTTTRTITTTVGTYNTLGLLISFTAGGAATGTLQLFLEDSFDGGTTWNDLVSSNTFTFGAAASKQQFFITGQTPTSGTQGSAPAVETLTAGTARIGPFGDRIRVREVVSGVSGSPTGVTYTITGIGKV